MTDDKKKEITEQIEKSLKQNHWFEDVDSGIVQVCVDNEKEIITVQTTTENKTEYQKTVNSLK